MKTGYFECFAGAAGDMICAALIGAGANFDNIKSQIMELGLPELKDIQLINVQKCGIGALKFEPVIEHSHSHHHGSEHDHSHHHHHSHRNLNDINAIIESSNLKESIKKSAKAIFWEIAVAEGKIHQKDPCEVHFHEVGAVDSIVDIIGACIGFDELGLDKVYCSKISLGGGTVKCAHGVMPVPAPATAELVKDMPVKGGPIDKELLTPTGAAILSYFVDEYCTSMPEMKIENIGYGGGTLDPAEIPNVLRLTIGNEVDSDSEVLLDKLVLLETNIDDATGEEISCLTSTLIEAGCLDVHTTPIFMKKGRPAIRLTVLCKTPDSNRIEGIIWASGFTLGLQRQYIDRVSLKRSISNVKTTWGEARVKLAQYAGKLVFVKAEYEDCKAISSKHEISIREVAREAEKIAASMNPENS